LVGAVVTDHYGLKVLGDTDRDHPRGTGGLLQEGAHGVDLALALLELEQRDAMVAGEGLDGLAEVVTDGGEEGGRGDGVTEVAGEEGDHLSPDLKAGDVGVEVDAIEAMEVEAQMLIEKLVELGGGCHGALGDNGSAWDGDQDCHSDGPGGGGSRPLRERPQGSALTPRALPPGSFPGGVT